RRRSSVDYEDLARGTVQIECGSSRGSGFHFLSPDVVVTNHHVILPSFQGGAPVIVHAESGSTSQADVVSYSDEKDKDFAILKLRKSLGSDRVPLLPSTGAVPTRGLEVAYAGYPRGIGDLLVQRAIVAGPYLKLGFY